MTEAEQLDQYIRLHCKHMLGIDNPKITREGDGRIAVWVQHGSTEQDVCHVAFNISGPWTTEDNAETVRIGLGLLASMTLRKVLEKVAA